jgi:hypothetical protein
MSARGGGRARALTPSSSSQPLLFH